MLMIPQNSLNILTNPLIFVRSNLKACSGTYEGRNYSGTPLYGQPLNPDTRILRTVSFVPSHIFSLKFNPLSGNTDTSYYGQGTLFCVPSDKLSYIVNPALRALFIYVLSIFNLSAESQIKSVSTKKSHGLSQMIPFSCFKNNRVILVRDCGNFERNVSLLTLFAVTKRFVVVNMFSLVCVSTKHVSETFS